MHGREVELDGVSMTFGAFTAVHPTSLRIEAGEFFSILGPSGCGKTTILRLVSGFLEPTTGTIRIGGVSMLGVPPNRRPTALIFQNLALFPLMPVWENVAFGLEARGVAKAVRRRRAEELLALVALDGQGHKLPTDLSGGQRQRVAIARALAVEPSVLLLDEPLSALDLKLRQHMRAELRAIQERVGITFVYITHDQGEALAMSDRVAVMSQGRIEQVATPDQLYGEPATPFVATFVGENNLLRGRVREAGVGALLADTGLGPIRAGNPAGLAAGAEAMIFVRPERLSLSPAPTGDNRVEGRIARRTLEGAFLQLAVATRDGGELLVHQVNGGHGADLTPGAAITLSFTASDARALPTGMVARD
jgi:spermidine/putrescine transport system ATP-binding protein